MVIATDDTALEVWGTYFGKSIGNGGPILSAISAELVRTELNGFSPSNIIFSGSDRQAVAALKAYTFLEVNQIGVGKVLEGYIINPKYAVTENDDSTITLDVWPVTEELKWIHAGRFEATTWLSQILNRIADRFLSDTTWKFNVTPFDTITTVKLTNPKVLSAVLEIGKDNDYYVRQGRDAFGFPTRILEVGQFEAAPIHVLSSPNGADASLVRENTLTRLISDIEWQPGDATNLCNVTTPYGGGSDITTLVTLERCWRIINDPSYPNFNRYGTDEESKARTGLASIFYNYDPNYPIDDPKNPATGQIQVINKDGNILTVFAGGPSYQVYINSGYVLYQGAYNTRQIEVDGSKNYRMYDKRSYYGDPNDLATFPGWGHKEDGFIDSGLNYPSDAPVSAQEITSMALYSSTIAMFKQRAHPHHIITASTDSVAFPTPAGDLIAVDYQRNSADDSGVFSEINQQVNMKVMKVTTSYPAMRDKYILSNTGRFEEDDAIDSVSQAATIQALQMKQGTFLSLYPPMLRENVDALNPMTVWVLCPRNLVRWQEFRVRVDFAKWTGTSTTAGNIPGTKIYVYTPVTDVIIDTGGNSLDLVGGTHDGTGFVSNKQSVTGLPVHFHQIPIYSAGGSATPTQNTDDNTHTSKWTYVFSAQNVFRLTANNSGPGILETNPNMNRQSSPAPIDLTPLDHTGVTPLNRTIKNTFAVIGRIAAQTIVGELPVHTHDLDKKIPLNGPVPAHCLMSVDGLALPAKTIITSDNRSLDGSFPNSFEVQDISEYMNQPGASLPLTFASLADVNSNPTGAGCFQVTILAIAEITGLTPTVRLN